MLSDVLKSFVSHRWAYIYCAIASIGALCYGYDNSYYTGLLGMAPFIDQYGDGPAGAKALSVTFTSLTSSSIYIGDLLGALLAAPINDYFGRKWVFFVAALCILGGGIAQIADRGSMGVIVLGRILIGLGVGQFTVTSLLYIGEVAPVAVRGPALMMFQFLQSCSQLVASGLNQGTETIPNSASFRIPMGGLVVLPVILLGLLPFIPESPFWLLAKGKDNRAANALRRINRNVSNYSPDEDMASHQENLDRERARSNESTWASLWTDRIERRKTVYACGAMFSQQINGILFFYVYGVVFAQAIGISQPFLITLITNILQIFAVGASVVFQHKMKRRLNLLVTTGMMVFAFIVIGGIGTKPLTTASQYVIVVFSYVIIVAFNVGLGPLAYTVAREMAVGHNQNKIMSMAIVVFFVTTWAVSFTAPYMYYTANLGPMLGFVDAGTSIISVLYIWFCVGETNGRTILEIETFFQDGIPVRAWETHVFPPAQEQAVSGMKYGEALSCNGGGGEAKSGHEEHVESL